MTHMETMAIGFYILVGLLVFLGFSISSSYPDLDESLWVGFMWPLALVLLLIRGAMKFFKRAFKVLKDFDE